MKKIEQATSKDALVEFKNWIKKAGDLEHRFFSFGNDMTESCIEQIYLEPKSFVAINGTIDDRFVVIGVCKTGESICLSVSEEIGKGKVFCHHYQTINERFQYDGDGNVSDYEQDDVYGFAKLSDSFGKFVEEDLYTDMCFDGVEKLELSQIRIN